MVQPFRAERPKVPGVAPEAIEATAPAPGLYTSEPETNGMSVQPVTFFQRNYRDLLFKTIIERLEGIFDTTTNHLKNTTDLPTV